MVQDAQINDYPSDDYMNVKRPKRSQVRPFGKENDFRPYYQERRQFASEEFRSYECNQIRPEFAGADNVGGERYNWRKVGRPVRDSLR